jgi:hypothetical protein
MFISVFDPFFVKSDRLLNPVQFEIRRFQFRSSLSGEPWKIGTTGFELDGV